LTREEVPPTAPPASRPTAQERGPRRASSVEARPARRSAAEDAPVAEARPARRNAEEDAPVAEGRRSRTRRRDTRGRDAEESFTSEGISYQVRSIADGDVVADSDAASTNGSASTPTGDHWDGPVDEVFINVGRDDGARAEDVEDVLGGSEVPAGDIAYVRVRQRHTFIGVRKGLLEQVVTALNGQRIADREVEAQPARPRPARRQS
jgi:ATP-dependent RNA helicase DeaD